MLQRRVGNIPKRGLASGLASPESSDDIADFLQVLSTVRLPDEKDECSLDLALKELVPPSRLGIALPEQGLVQAIS